MSDQVPAGIVVVTTRGSGSMDLCGDRLAAHLPVRRLESDIGARSAERFRLPALGAASARALAADAAFVGRLRRGRPRLWHFTNHHTLRYAPFGGAPFVASVYDVIRQLDAHAGTRYISAPNLRDRAVLRLDAGGIRRAVALSAPSHATKRDLVEHLRIPPERISVIHLGVDHRLFRPVEGRPVAAPYVLYVGSEHPRKSLVTLLRAVAALRRDRRFGDVALVKVGDPGKGEAPFRAATRAAVDDLGLAGSVLFAGRVSDAALAKYYSHAACLVLPSLAEGFGLPVAEAMACGCPAVVSTAGSLPEVAGDGGLIFPPGDVDALRRALTLLLGDAGARRELSDRARRRAEAFSWERAARETVRLYAVALGEAAGAPGDIEAPAAPDSLPVTLA